MPEFLKYKDEDVLKTTYEDIVIKDIAVRYKIENVKVLRELYIYLISTFSQKFSYNSLKKFVSISSINTIIKYIFYLEETYFLKLITRFDFSPKKQLISEKKAYFIDNGFIRLISNKITKDKGWLLENLVLNNLDGLVYFSLEKNECDFVIKEGLKITQAIQVCYNLDEENKEREINGLKETMKKYKLKEGLLLTYDQEEDMVFKKKKIKIMPVWKWLLSSLT